MLELYVMDLMLLPIKRNRRKENDDDQKKNDIKIKAFASMMHTGLHFERRGGGGG